MNFTPNPFHVFVLQTRTASFATPSHMTGPQLSRSRRFGRPRGRQGLAGEGLPPKWSRRTGHDLRKACRDARDTHAGGWRRRARHAGRYVVSA